MSSPGPWKEARTVRRKVAGARGRGESSIDFRIQGHVCALSWEDDQYEIDVDGVRITGSLHKIDRVVRILAVREVPK
ncbi:hypothetical protein RBB84_02505 [Rhodococcus sp. D-6]|uniref:Uncharacterized protein n=1 Tax=Rhodococcus sp. D-6 TaxID=1387842 RepID=A0AAU7UYZ7_9NOCA|nr:hypothetical protein [Rhodococcus sp. HS-D2]